MLRSLVDLLMGCSHQRTTFPLTPTRRSAAPGATRNTSTYVVCLDCGKEFDYNWKEMRLGHAVVQHPAVPAETVDRPAYWRQPAQQHPREGTHTV
jgi:hypothetical protein